MASIFLGTLGLTLVALVALVLTVTRSEVFAGHVPRIRRVAAVTILFQLGHFIEETLYDFYVRFPEVFGLAPWSREFFLAFNLFWLAVWLVAVLGINALRRAGVFALWFLAIASIANGVVHPLLAFSVSGYFPGLWTSPFIGIFGVILFGTINAATDRGKRHGTSASA